MVEGRLTPDEFAERAELAYGAKTARELQKCLHDLPRDRPAMSAALAAERRSWYRHRLARFAMPNVVCIGVWALGSGWNGSFWPGWVLFVTGVGLTRRLLHGPPDPDAEADEKGAAPLQLRWDDRPNAENEAGARVVTTALFVDVVGSTERAAALGDASWSELLREHQRLVRAQLDEWGGKEIFTRGDEVVAGFDGPARAVQCSEKIRDAARSLGLEVRAGLHAGEVQWHGTDVSGITLHIGQRVSSFAAPGEILVSSTVRDMVAGSGIRFEDRGEFELRGVPGLWRLFAVVG
jgi:class 3 adenylate cyclase